MSASSADVPGPGSLAPVLEVDGISKRFGDVLAVDRLSFSLAPGEFVTLLGPSGCGKTTALRVIAGFERPDEGSVRFGKERVTDWTPQRRGFGMVFQNYALFPHLNVFENVAFGLKSRRRPKDEIGRRVEAALERVDLAGYGERAVQALSGGQQQRVALARALAIEPPLLLLDEPLSNLDAALRERTRKELRLLVKELGITALFVTHDQEEAFDLSDRIAVMSEGRLRQLGTPRALYEEPADRFVAGFVGRANTLRGTIERGMGGTPGMPGKPGTQGTRGSPGTREARGSVDEGAGRRAMVAVRLGGGARWPLSEGAAPGAIHATDALDATEILLLVRPEDLHFVEPGREGALSGRLLDRRFGGAHTTYFVDVEEGAAAAIEVVSDAGGPRVGDTVHLLPRPDARLHLFAPG